MEQLYGGIDLHANNSVIALLQENDKVVFEKRLPNDLNTILSYLAPYHDQIVGVVVESTYNWYWLVDGLMEKGYGVHLAHTAGMKQYEGLKYRNDHVDARHLAHLLRLGILPLTRNRLKGDPGFLAKGTFPRNPGDCFHRFRSTLPPQVDEIECRFKRDRLIEERPRFLKHKIRQPFARYDDIDHH
jgi:hypothetical protein